MIGGLIGEIAGNRNSLEKKIGFHLPLIPHESVVGKDTYVTLSLFKYFIESVSLSAALSNNSDVIRSLLPKENTGSFCTPDDGALVKFASVIGWMETEESKVIKQSKLLTEHFSSSPRCIAWTQAVALSIFLSKNGVDVATIYKELRELTFDDFVYNFSGLRKQRSIVASNQIPIAICCALEAKSFEEAIRNCFMVGTDLPVMCFVAGTIAESRYGVSSELWLPALNPLLLNQEHVYFDIAKFYQKIGLIKGNVSYSDNLINCINYCLVRKPSRFERALWKILRK
ncbi:ADP-ribosylglycohydrolase family protein [Photobacterium kishitanii]|uniref:ADP-ribosylglycohydrolase n=1 Tax=Photobacterium kishitanii TaxID=318456 RepID=A0A2T3KMM5_9GAMM|nr:ADP-ribosylglycohydrolase family protein [Photobacterium kishitanii]PSV01041.1 hypothetical protein C9J27_03155 [Photobacterium kishitanii]